MRVPLAARVALVALIAAGCARQPATGIDAAVGDTGDLGALDLALPDVGPSPVCVPGGTATLPAGATAEADGRTWSRACPDHILAVTVVDDGTVRLRRRDTPAATHRSWAVVGAPVPVAVEAGSAPDGALVVCTGALVVRVDDACRAALADGAGHALIADAPEGYDAAAHTLRHTLDPDDHLFGLGSQTGALERRGRRFTLWNTDPYDPAHGGFPPDAAPMYPSIPFVVGLRRGVAWGLFVDDSHRLVVDAGAADPARLTVAAADAALDEYLFVGPRPADVLARYTALTGRPTLPPRWALGFHQSRWGYYPASQVQAIAAELRARHLPADGLWLDIQHMDGFRSFTWDPSGFADPAGLVGALAQSGFKTTVIVDPGIKVDAAWDVYQDGLAAHAYLAAADGTPYVGSAWPGQVVFPDFSAPSVRAWWSGLVARPLALGVRGIWIDMNEPTNIGVPPMPETLPAAGDGTPTTMAELHNAYALLEARATYEGMRQAAPAHRPFIVSRAGFAGLQRYAGVWTGDAPSDFATLAETPAMMLGIAASGIPLVGSDVGGYSGHATAELYARWLEVGAMSPFFRAHVTENVPGQEPWAFGPDVEAIARAVIGERYTLLPYWYSLFAAAAATGAPPLRPLAFEFPDDAAALAVGDEAMLGPWLLYAPVLAAGVATRSVYLPPGRWYELRSGAPYAGGATVTRAVTLAELPAFVRAGAILPRAPVLDWSDQAPIDPLTLDVWPDDTPSTLALYDDAGDGAGPSSTTTYALVATATGARLSASARQGSFAPPARTLRLRVHAAGAAPSAATLDGAPVAATWDADDATITIAFADHAPFTVEVTYDRAAPIASTVHVPVRVRPPAGTPTTAPLAIATSANGWTQQPLAWQPDGSATGTIEAPRGAWVEYKYTRGGWSTVEKGADCSELPNRRVLAAAHPGADDIVARWADGCP